MAFYIFRRLLLIIPTLFGILTLTFIIVQFVPGGPVELAIARLQGLDKGPSANFSGASSDMASASTQAGLYRGGDGIDQKIKDQLNKQYGLDKPLWERYWLLLKNYTLFDFGKSFQYNQSVLTLIRQRLPVSISLGLWMTLISYAISIPLGIGKAMREGSWFDTWTSAIVIIGYAIPGFLFAILLLVLFAGGSFWNIFPNRGLVSEGFANFTLLHQITDYFWHIILPVSAMVLSAFATTTLLTKNSFLEEIRKLYVQTARMKGASEARVLYGHVFRNAMMIVIAGLPGAFVGALLTSSLLIENIFSLDGLGHLSYDALQNRDYPVVFANIYIFALIGLVINLVSDLTYAWVDPRIDFETRDV